MLRKTWQNRVISHIQENSSLYIFVSVLLLMGVVFGAILVNSLQVNQKQDLSFYLNRFLDKFPKVNLQLRVKCFEKVTFHN